MRIYTDFNQARSEIERDLVEMGIVVHAKSWQDKDVSNDPNFRSMELQNYMYMVIDPDPNILPAVQPWADAEWIERLNSIVEGKTDNPGTAWKLRQDVWSNFLTNEGKFGYTYGERFVKYDQVNVVINRIMQDPDSRQLWLAVWDVSDIENLGGVSRVPCTLGYQIQVREGKLNLLYVQRSSDFHTHFVNDVYMAIQLQHYIAKRTGYPVGNFTHLIMSLHLFNKDTSGVF